jgi:peroxin-12
MDQPENAYRPSFFEMIAQDRLMLGLKPALKHCMLTVASWYPSISIIKHYHAEMFYSLMYFLEKHYLKVYDASFSENFYGLKRVQVKTRALAFSINGSDNQNDRMDKLSRSGKRYALIMLILIPYVRDKLDVLFERLKNPLVDEDGFEFQDPAERDAANNQSNFTKYFIGCYPYMYAAIEAICFVFQLRFLFESSCFFSPGLLLLRQHVQRLTMQDMRNIQEHGSIHVPAPIRLPVDRDNRGMNSAWSEANSNAGSGSSSWINSMRRFVGNVEYFMADYAKSFILAGLLSFKILEWWYSHANTSRVQKQLPNPPAPKPLDSLTISRLNMSHDKSLCGLCHQKRTNPAITLTGYAFCYPCLFNYVQTHGRCPITSASMSVEHIRRIYES